MAIDFLDFALYILTGAGVGFLIGLTGVGGGSLMTPLLIMSNIPYHIAIGTDLLYASITKASGVFVHHKRGNIQWRIMIAMSLGSIPAAILTAVVVNLFLSENTDAYKGLLTTSLGFMLLATSFVLLFREQIQQFAFVRKRASGDTRQASYFMTGCAGFVLGILVTLSSVGAGAFGTAILMVLFSRLPAMHIIGTDLAHAVPLTFVAGMSHFLILNNVDFVLLAGLLAGSIPTVYFGAKVASRLPERFMYNMLAIILILLGIRFAFF